MISKSSFDMLSYPNIHNIFSRFMIMMLPGNYIKMLPINGIAIYWCSVIAMPFFWPSPIYVYMNKNFL